jgi:hypothetical protein
MPHTFVVGLENPAYKGYVRICEFIPCRFIKIVLKEEMRKSGDWWHSESGLAEVGGITSLYEFDWKHIFPHQPADSTARKGNGRLRWRYERHVILDKQADGFLQVNCDIAEMVKSAAFANCIRKTAIRSVRGYKFEIDPVSRQGKKLYKGRLQGIVNNWRARRITEARHVRIRN